MLRESYNHLDVNITSLFLNNIAQFYVGNVVRLNTGDIGEIILISKYNVTRPLIKVESKFFDLSKNYEYEIVEVIR
jgi:HD-GYP domain-containing protein (c-di-GMP phosphodiesterase class II)